MTLNKYQKFCYDRFGSIAEQKVTDKLTENLESAHINIRGAAYLSWAWFTSIWFYLSLSLFL